MNVVCKVDDSYDGGVKHETNWNKGNYVTGITGKEVPIATWEEGPVELSNKPESWSEILRTQRFATRAEAEAYAEKLTKGAYEAPYRGYSVAGPMYKYADKANRPISDFGAAASGSALYKVRLSRTSEIQLAGSFEETFREISK